MINIVIFGIGETYANRRNFFRENSDRVRIVAFLDNNTGVQGKEMDGIMIYSPEDIKKLCYDGIVILSKKFGQEMAEQLSASGIEQDVIWNFYTLKLNALKGKRTLHCGNKAICKSNRKKILIISTEMGFNGGTMVAVYAALALQNMGYEVMIAAPCICEKLLEEIKALGLNITIWDCLPYIFQEDEEWIRYYDIVIVNVFQMMNCAFEISKIRPVLWWIHEDRSVWKSFYQDTQKEFHEINTLEWMDRLEVLGVSEIAKEAFNYFYPSVIERILPFGIPDRFENENTGKPEFAHNKIVFAVTAGFSIYKGQSVLVEAVKKLSIQEKEAIEIWFIGPSGQNKQELEDICTEKDNMKFLGLLSHEEIIGILPQINVLVCPSLIETMSMSTIEGMMFEKICIATDMTGIAEYIDDGKNGFVVKANDSNKLAECMSWIINNRSKWEPIRKEARKTFENEFILERFGQRLEEELNNCQEKFYENTINVSSTIS